MLRAEGLGDWGGKKFSDSQNQINSSQELILLLSSLSSSVQVTAGKIVPKSLLTKSHQKEKMSQEIRFAEKNS